MGFVNYSFKSLKCTERFITIQIASVRGAPLLFYNQAVAVVIELITYSNGE